MVDAPRYLSETCTVLAKTAHKQKIYAGKIGEQNAETPSIRSNADQNINMVLMMRGYNRDYSLSDYES